MNVTPSSAHHLIWPFLLFSLLCPLTRHDEQGEGYALVRTAAGSADTSSPPDAPADSTRSEEDGLPDISHIAKEKEKVTERERERGEDSILNPLLQPSQGPEPDPLSVAEAADRPVSAE
jgi:hypothetical protein